MSGEQEYLTPEQTRERARLADLLARGVAVKRALKVARKERERAAARGRTPLVKPVHHSMIPPGPTKTKREVAALVASLAAMGAMPLGRSR